MKQILFSLFLVFWIASLSAQPITKQDYLEKSKNQKTFAFILTAGGIAVMGGGVLFIEAGQFAPNRWIGPGMAGAGFIMWAGGISLFEAAKKNINKANSMTLNFKLDQTIKVINTVGIRKYYPALAIQIHLK